MVTIAPRTRKPKMTSQAIQRDTEEALASYLQRYLGHCQRQTGSLPMQPFDPDWPSPCQVGEPDAEGAISWRPRQRAEPADFAGLERALEVPLHPSVKAFYGTWWCDVLEAQAEEGRLSLIQIWSPDDFDRFGENLIGHALAKQRLSAPLTVFFACTDEDDYILSVDNVSGGVLLEQPGHDPVREVCASLGQFLARLNPVF